MREAVDIHFGAAVEAIPKHAVRPFVRMASKEGDDSISTRMNSMMIIVLSNPHLVIEPNGAIRAYPDVTREKLDGVKQAVLHVDAAMAFRCVPIVLPLPEA